MKWVLRDRQTQLLVAVDLLSGYCFTRSIKRACLFDSIKSARETVLLVCNGQKEINRKARLEILKMSQLRSVDRRRYFHQLNRTKG